MDMNKEKNAYEKHLLSQGVDFMYLPNIQFNELENIYEMIEWDGEYDDALNELNSSWCTWQAAKASAVPDGFKIVSFKQISELVVAVNKVDLMTHAEQKTNEVRLAWQDIASKLQAMIEAVQEQNQ